MPRGYRNTNGRFGIRPRWMMIADSAWKYGKYAAKTLSAAYSVKRGYHYYQKQQKRVPYDEWVSNHPVGYRPRLPKGAGVRRNY